MASPETNYPPTAKAELLQNRFGILPDSHYVEDVLAVNLGIVFCGTALGYASAKAKAYYAHSGNFFWRTLNEVGLTPSLIAPKDFASITQYGLGLTDLCKHAYGQDTQLPKDAFDVAALYAKIRKFQPSYLAFTSKTAAAVFLDIPTGKIAYGLQPENFHGTQLFVLPSPSGQARIFWDKAPWQDLANLNRSMPQSNGDYVARREKMGLCAAII